MLTKDEHIICTEYLISLIDFDRVYDHCADISKKKFTKDNIIKSIQKMIREYPHFDKSVEGRIESFTMVLSARKGTMNNYMYFMSGLNSEYNEWFLSENRFLETMKYLDDRAHNVIWFNTKEYLKSYKLNKLINNLV
jgi:hypothetical protein